MLKIKSSVIFKCKVRIPPQPVQDAYKKLGDFCIVLVSLLLALAWFALVWEGMKKLRRLPTCCCSRKKKDSWLQRYRKQSHSDPSRTTDRSIQASIIVIFPASTRQSNWHCDFAILSSKFCAKVKTMQSRNGIFWYCYIYGYCRKDLFVLFNFA